MRNLLRFIFILISLAPTLSFAQFFSWTDGGGGIENDFARQVSTNDAGSIFMVGIANASADFVRIQNDSFQVAGGQDAFLMKFANNGDLKLIIPAGGTGDDVAKAVLADNSGSVFWGGGVEDPIFIGALQTNHFGKSFFISAHDTLGVSNWVFTADSTFANGQPEITSIAEQGTNLIASGFYYGDIVVAGTKYSGDPQIKMPFVLSISKTGNLNWFKPIMVGASSNLNDIAVDGQGNIYIGGSFRNSLTLDGVTINANAKTDIFLAKLNSSGNRIWLNRYGGAEHEGINSVDVLNNTLVYGGYFRLNLTISGQTISSALNTDAFYAIADTSGTVLELEKLGGSQTDEVSTVSISPNKKIAIAGYVNDNPIIKGKAFVNFKLTGYVLLVDSSNNLLKRRVFDVNSNQSVTAVDFIDDDQIAVAGNFIGTTLFDPYGSLNTNGKNDFFIAKMRDCIGKVPAPISYLTNDTVCKGDSITFSSSSAPNKTYKWLRNNQIITGENNNTLSVYNPGNYKVIVNFDGCEDTSKALRAAFLPKPTATIQAFPDVCEGQDSLVLTQGNPSGGEYSGPGVANGKFDPQLGVGTYLIKYTVVGSSGCVDSAQRNLNVGPVPAVSFPNLPTLCSHDTILPLNTATPKGGTYTGIGVFNSTFNASVGFGTWDIVYTYTNASGCTNTDTSSIQVDSLPKIDIEDVGRVCLFNGIVTLNNASPAGGVYEGGGISGNQFDPTQTGIGIFFHSYTVTVPSGCTNTRIATITVEDAPKPLISTDSVFICDNASFNITTLNQNYSAYKWEGGSTDTVATITSDILEIGGQYLSLEVVNDLGCSGYDSVFVQVSKCNVLTVYPNPSTGIINMGFNSAYNGEASLQMFNTAGIKVYEQEVAYLKGENLITLEDFSSYSGIYTLVLIFDDHYLHKQIMLLNNF